MKKEYPGASQRGRLGRLVADEKEGKVTIVVDEDIDVRNPFQVEWAMSFHSQPVGEQASWSTAWFLRELIRQRRRRMSRNMIPTQDPQERFYRCNPQASLPTRGAAPQRIHTGRSRKNGANMVK